MENHAYITIKEAATQLGVTHRTLKYYEELGMVVPKRTRGRYRLYDDNDLILLKRIIRLRALGFSLSTIQEIISRPMEVNEAGAAEYSLETLRDIASAIEKKLNIVIQRIESARQELSEAGKLKNELTEDLTYLARRIAGESSAALTSERLASSKYTDKISKK
ncbi:MerR family transcriptional regulator [Pantoea piersonii]|uniref:MerR family transcriptional regulator n=1 Tax=Pantoea piersonii TaxID=2364647 RepID=UPI000EA29456|nr:MerR family transcriptional regulator [Pantoea piersonii]MBZ6386774.1 MerR family transcriptional regulator [Pantoea piersonii]MBZ6400077.1 MerR family transcriptional regulator [Pantoea piersonii]MBZ6410079.1 MerR family transcriptional regulator [Pantoea piersonii]MBZ6426128.1 MerR family transcriptional regulator [Pantoea piersonii]NYB04647.1 MerR family transcriptional regulator [Pantoea piersonii]